MEEERRKNEKRMKDRVRIEKNEERIKLKFKKDGGKKKE